MVVTISKTQAKIIDAFFRVVADHPNERITVEMISNRAGMSRENLYRNHFKGIPEIIEKVHFLVDSEINCEFREFINSNNPNILIFLSQNMLPFLYQKRDWLKVLYKTNIDPGWFEYIENNYTPLVEKYLDQIGKKDVISNFFLSQIIVKEFFAIVSVWLSDDNPEPPSLFIKKFIHIFQQSPAELLTQKSDLSRNIYKKSYREKY